VGLGCYLRWSFDTDAAKVIGRHLYGIRAAKGLAEQEYGPRHPITRKPGRMHEDAQSLLQYVREVKQRAIFLSLWGRQVKGV
jgi:hypothetical protein